METEKFKTQREFNNKFPSKFYICSNCGRLINDKYTCDYCGWRADGLFKTMDKGYKFIIEEQSEEIQEIFRPIEVFRKGDDAEHQTRKSKEPDGATKIKNFESGVQRLCAPE